MLALYYMRNFKEERYIPVKSLDQALLFADKMAEQDLQDDTCACNTFDLIVYEPDGTDEPWKNGEQWMDENFDTFDYLMHQYGIDDSDCPHGGSVENDCEGCAYSGDYHFVDGECVARDDDDEDEGVA